MNDILPARVSYCVTVICLISLLCFITLIICIFSILGQDDFEYFDIAKVTNVNAQITLLNAFGQAGFGNQTRGAYKLLPCAMGTFVNSSVVINDDNDLKCLECPAGGFYSETEAYVNDSCQYCPNGTFVHYNKAPGKSRFDCKACPLGTDIKAFAGFRACNCLSDFYRTHLYQECKPCVPDGLKCLNECVTLESGYWWKWKTEIHRELYTKFTVNLKNASFSPTLHVSNNSFIEYPFTLPQPHRCPIQEACTGSLNSSCNVGYHGPLCAVCSDGYYKQLKTCKLCPTKGWMAAQLSVVAVISIIFVIVVVWRSKKESRESTERSFVDILLGKIKIVIGFYQVTSGVLDAFSYIKWPQSLSLLGKYSEILQLDILQIVPVHCVIPNIKIDAFGNMFAILALNGAAIVVAFASFGLTKLILTRRNLNEEEKRKKTSNAKLLIYRNLFFFLHVTYLSTFSKIAKVIPLACHEVCVDEEKESCQTYLKADYSIHCTGPTYKRLLMSAYFATLYLILLPIACLIVIWKQRSAAVSKIENAETGNETCDVENQGEEAVTGLQFLFENYKPSSWYWELVETIRKIILTSGFIFLGGKSRAYIGLAGLMSGLYGMLFAYKKPILDPFENNLMVTALAVTLANLITGVVSRIPTEGMLEPVDPYMDSVMFNVLVLLANFMVIGLLVVQYLLFVYRYIREWRKHPQWSFSCCLALLLPLNNLQGEILGMAGRNVLTQQIQSCEIEMPSISGALKDSGAVDFTLENDVESPAESDHTEVTTSENLKSTEPSISSSLKDSGAVEVTTENDVESVAESGHTEVTTSESLKSTERSISSALKDRSGAVKITIENDVESPAECDHTEVTTSESLKSTELSISSALKDSGAVKVTIENDVESPAESGHTEMTTRESQKSTEPSMSSAIKDSGAVEVTIENAVESPAKRDHTEVTTSESLKGTESPISSALKDSSGAIEITLENDVKRPAECDHTEATTNESLNSTEQGVLPPAAVCMHELPRGTYDTSF